MLFNFIFLMACSTSTPPESTSAGENAHKKGSYFDFRKFDFAEVIDGPPAEGSDADKDDYAQIKALQKKRTKEQCEVAKSEVSYKNLADLFEKPKGPLTHAEVAVFKVIFDQLESETKPIWTLAKNKWKRPRPYFVVSGIRPCIKKETSTSYPSAHAALGQMGARILAFAYPKKDDEILARGKEIGDHRVLGGVHHPTDVEAGRKLGDAIFERLMENTAFEKALKKAKSK